MRLYILLMRLYILLSLEQNEWSAKTNENNYQNKFLCHPEQQMWCQNKSEEELEHVIIIDRTRYYYSENNLLL
jgi:hypothetical protein